MATTAVQQRRLAPLAGSVLIWAVVLAGVAVGARYAYQRYHASKAASAGPEYFLQPVSSGTVVDAVAGSGTFTPVATLTVATAVAGTVSQVDVQVGQQVAKGQTLLQLSDTAGLSQQVATAQAALEAAQTNLQEMQDPSLTVDPTTVAQDRLLVQQAQLALQYAQTQWQQAQAAAAAAAEATTPSTGTVEAVDVVSGQPVTAGTVLATVQPASTTVVTVSVPQQDLPYLPLGTTAAIGASDLGVTAAGTVTGFGTPSLTSGSAASGRGGAAQSSTPAAGDTGYPVNVTLDSSAPALPSGALVTVTFQPAGTPPAGDTWSDSGTVTDPTSAVPITAAQAGTVDLLVQAGSAVQAGARIATVTPTTTPAQLTQDQNTLTQDQASLQQAQSNLQAAENPAPPSAAAIAAQQQTVTVDQNNLQTDQNNLTALTVQAPVAGTVQSVTAQTGAKVGSGTAVVTVQQAGQLSAQVDVDELDIAQIKSGQTATVTVPSFPAHSYVATVTGIAPVSTTLFGVSYYPVDLSIQGLPAGVRPGMTFTANILVKQVANALRVPAWAVTTLGGGNAIVRTLQNGRAVPVPVKLGVTSTQWDQVLSGVGKGEQVIAGDTAAASTTGAGAFFLLRGGGAFRGGGGGGGPRGG